MAPPGGGAADLRGRGSFLESAVWRIGLWLGLPVGAALSADLIPFGSGIDLRGFSVIAGGHGRVGWGRGGRFRIVLLHHGGLLSLEFENPLGFPCQYMTASPVRFRQRVTESS